MPTPSSGSPRIRPAAECKLDNGHQGCVRSRVCAPHTKRHGSAPCSTVHRHGRAPLMRSPAGPGRCSSAFCRCALFSSRCRFRIGLYQSLGNVRQAPNATAKARSIWSVDRKGAHVVPRFSVSVPLPVLLSPSRPGLLRLVHWTATVGGDGWPSCWDERETAVLCLRLVTQYIHKRLRVCLVLKKKPNDSGSGSVPKWH